MFHEIVNVAAVKSICCINGTSCLTMFILLCRLVSESTYLSYSEIPDFDNRRRHLKPSKHVIFVLFYKLNGILAGKNINEIHCF